MRNVPRDSIQAVVGESYRAAGGIEAAAADLGMSIGTLSEHTDVPKGKRAGGLGINYADTLARMHAPVAAVYAQHFARLAGGVFQPVEIGGNVASLYSHCGSIAKECGEAQAATIRAAEANNAAALDDADRELDEAVAALLRAKAEIAKRRVAA